MKKAALILTSDWHARDTFPICRTDNFEETLWKKMDFVKALQEKHNCDIIHGGDLFHHWKPSPYLISKMIEHLPKRFFSIYGQHDLPQHNFEARDKSGIHVLEKAGALTVLPGVHWNGIPTDSDYIKIKGDEITRKILVWHKMVWKGKRPWPGCTDPSAVAMLRKYKQVDIILTGDNHQAFIEEYEGRIHVNPGSLTRQSAGQIDFEPRVYLYFAESNTVEAVFLPIEREAVSRSHIEKDEKRTERIGAFIEKIDGNWEASMSFENNLTEFFKINQTLSSVKDIIYKAIEI